jgi:hypothetical protein
MRNLRTILLVLLGVVSCIALALLAVALNTDPSQAATQTARQKALDDYMTVYGPGGATAPIIPPTVGTSLATLQP